MGIPSLEDSSSTMRTTRCTSHNCNTHLHNQLTGKAMNPKVSDPRPKGGKAKGTSKSFSSPTVYAPGESRTTFHRKVALTVVRWEPVRKLVLTRQILLHLLGKKPKSKNVKRRTPHMPPTKDKTTILVNLLNSPWTQIGTQRGAAKGNGNRGEEMINGETKDEIRERISTSISWWMGVPWKVLNIYFPEENT